MLGLAWQETFRAKSPQMRHCSQRARLTVRCKSLVSATRRKIVAFPLEDDTNMAENVFAELPNDKPKLEVESRTYEPGDLLEANCSSPASRPRTELTLTLNNQVVSAEEKTNNGTIPEK